MRRRLRFWRGAVVSLLSPWWTGCAGGWGAGGGGGGADSISVLMVNNPQMVDLQQLTAKHFTAETGIKVNFTVLPENDVRDKISQEFSSQAGQYDVASVSNFEIPIYARSRWLASLDPYIEKDPAFDQKDILKPMVKSLSGEDGKVYGQPFYGESSFLMYRKDVMKAKGIKVPAKPTWQEVADIAAKADGAQPGMAGICLRGQPGWGQVFAPLTTVVNTFGGTWFTKDWQAGVDAPPFEKAVKFYVDLVRKYGENGRTTSRIHRVPEQPHPGQRGHVVRRHLGCWFSGGGGLPGQGKDRVRRCTRRQDRQLGLALRLVVGHPAGQREEGPGVEVHLLGLRQGVRGAGRQGARLVAGACGKAQLDL